MPTDYCVKDRIIKNPSTWTSMKSYSNWCYYQLWSVGIIVSNIFTLRQYFTVWYFCMFQIIIPVNHFDQYGFRVPLDWIDSVILRKWFNIPLLECTHIARYIFWRCLCVYVQWSFFLVVWGVIKLGMVVTHVVFPRCPINEEVILLASIPNPIKAPIYILGAAFLNCFVNDT